MDMQASASWQSTVTAIGAMATPILVMVLTAIGWRLRNGIERRNELEDRLREDRIEIYNAILEPFILLLMPDAAWKIDPKNKHKDKFAMVNAKMLSLEYREHAFKLTLWGADAVVRAYNDLMQHFYALDETDQAAVSDARAESGRSTASDPAGMLQLLGTFLLEIRKSTGNESTKLGNWDMLEWWLKDARALRQRT